MDGENLPLASGSHLSQRIIALGVIFAFLYWASSVVIALLLAVLLAYFLDPAVKALEHLRVPRALGAILVLLTAAAVLGWIGYLMADRLQTFVDAWPHYSAVLRHAADVVSRNLANLEQEFSQLTQTNGRGAEAVRVEDTQPVRALLLRGLGSLYSILLVWTFLPFLVFFMLAGKHKIWRATLDLFEKSEQRGVSEALNQVSVMLRRYVAGSLFVGAIVVAASWLFFSLIGLQYSFVTALVSGTLSLVPYLGAVLSWLPPFLIGLGQWKTIGPFVGVAGVLSAFHLITANVLTPAIVGRQVRLNALSVTIALLFWGWLWGAVGLILAIPITASVKVVCDHVPGWQGIGRWLGA